MSRDRLRLLWHWMTMGPYHFARMNALAARPEVELTVVESASVDDHGWRRGAEAVGFQWITLSREARSREVLRRTSRAFRESLERTAPDVIVASGYREGWSRRAVLDYASSRRNVTTLFWTESTAWDRKHYWLLEKFKVRLVRQFDGALAAGTVHAEYLASLGMPKERVAVVGGCVDNQFFSSRAISAAGGRPYFLFVGRFVPQKNLSMLLEAYGRYRRSGADAWELVLVGGGLGDANLRGADGVRLAGLKQVEELPAVYAAAGCLVLPSLSEPWGLVVNEAMACGLPVLISRRCGCAADLVREGQNGFLFDPTRPAELAKLMEVVASSAADRAAFGAASRQIVSGFTVGRFAARTVSHLIELHRRKSGSQLEAVA